MGEKLTLQHCIIPLSNYTFLFLQNLRTIRFHLVYCADDYIVGLADILLYTKVPLHAGKGSAIGKCGVSHTLLSSILIVKMLLIR